jgi:hypothetical protein
LKLKKKKGIKKTILKKKNMGKKYGKKMEQYKYMRKKNGIKKIWEKNMGEKNASGVTGRFTLVHLKHLQIVGASNAGE